MAVKANTLSGFGGYFESEAVKGSLPIGQNSPQRHPMGLYAEQINGTAFTRPRSCNLRSWLYRIAPSVTHPPFIRYEHPNGEHLINTPIATPNQLRWDPIPKPNGSCHFIDGLIPWITSGSVSALDGAFVYLYCANQSMDNEFFYNADGELLIIPQEGKLTIPTEFGVLNASPGEIIVIPRGVKFQVKINNTLAKGYVCENFGVPFQLPDLGPIGANGLANPRDFIYPHAQFENRQGDFQLISKFQNQFWKTSLKHHPLDVVAWHGNYAPYCYDLKRFNVINTVSFDHPDPSIFTVLTSPSHLVGTANVDFVIFPERWMVAENTFRPPYYHRNIMSEYMGLIFGAYDAKGDEFSPGGGSLHNCMSAHGPDAKSCQAAEEKPLTPEKQENTLAFMLECNKPWQVTKLALESKTCQQAYHQCWQGLERRFTF